MSSFTWVQDSGKPLLTFDDGPHPETTPWILEYLEGRGIKAMFFVLGVNVELYPNLFDEIIDRGHMVGNHGYEHLSGWKLSVDRYKRNVERGAEISGSNIFRPPYGQIGYRQYQSIKEMHQVMMWSVMPGDFVEDIEVEQRMCKVNNSLSSVDIIVLHDNPRHFQTMKEMLSKLEV